MNQSTACGGLLGIMAKTPRQGKVKTRLAAVTSEHFALGFAQACLNDTWRQFARVDGLQTRLILDGLAEAGAQSELHVANELQPPPVIWPQADGDLGARMEAALRRGLKVARLTLLIGTDSPGLPLSHIHGALAALETHDAVLGPCDDGGFYLIGLRAEPIGCPPGLLADLPWSCAQTLDATSTRLKERGLEVALLPPWFDVDDQQGLKRLRQELASGRLDAPACSNWLEAILPSET